MMSSTIKTPEWIWRQDMWRKATGERKAQIAAWNTTWSRAGNPIEFPDFEDFINGHEQHRSLQGDMR